VCTAGVAACALQLWQRRHPQGSASLAAATAGVRYLPSSLENVWYGERMRGQICETAASSAQLVGAKLWVAYSGRAQQAMGERVTPTADEARVLSRFVTADVGQRAASAARDEYIEPLTGIARHPFAPVGCKPSLSSLLAHADSSQVNAARAFDGLYDTSYLIPANRCPHRAESHHPTPTANASDVNSDANLVESGSSVSPSASPRRPPEHHHERSYFFDLGCSHPGMWVRPNATSAHAPPPPPPEGGAHPSASKTEQLRYEQLEGIAWPSLPFFYDLYERSCITFERIFAWEATPYAAPDWWRHVPIDGSHSALSLPLPSVPSAH
jgi:hypothetical protein